MGEGNNPRYLKIGIPDRENSKFHGPGMSMCTTCVSNSKEHCRGGGEQADEDREGIGSRSLGSKDFDLHSE